MEKYPDRRAEHATVSAKQAGFVRSEAQRSVNAIRLLVLTGARKGEVLQAMWDQFDLERGVWTKPSHATKQKRMEYVPLNDAAVAFLKTLPRDGEYLFPGRLSEHLTDLKYPWPKSADRRISSGSAFTTCGTPMRRTWSPVESAWKLSASSWDILRPQPQSATHTSPTNHYATQPIALVTCSSWQARDDHSWRGLAFLFHFPHFSRGPTVRREPPFKRPPCDAGLSLVRRYSRTVDFRYRTWPPKWFPGE